MTTDSREDIQTALGAFSGPDLQAATTGLPNVFGYHSEKTLDLDDIYYVEANEDNALIRVASKRRRRPRKTK